MIRKIALTSVAALALVTITAQAEGMKCGQGKCGGAMKSTQKAGKGMLSNSKCTWKNKRVSVTLVKHLPNLMLIISKHENDPKLALTAEQKEKLAAARKERMPLMNKYKEEAMRLKKEIARESLSGSAQSKLKEKVEKLAKVSTDATMLKLRCIDETKAILTPAQMDYIMSIRKAYLEKRAAKRAQRKAARAAAKQQAAQQ